ncbi:DUF6037 family protein [Priestia aryabhattai]|uniref:DUF6037 family protein n=1 Tax=Priestia aryabhattai TaxID=412384 RepID=UPI0006549D7A|nr:DUF6037 family protein [Priestia aryabhattai]KMN92413.1 hypothetical protein ABV89_27420 [Priestia aryabhattai]
MQLPGLKPLYASMKQQNIDRCRFTFSFRKTVFDVMFFIDEKPYELLFGAKGKNFFFERTVNEGFKINTGFDRETYSELCKVLGLKYDPNNPFSPKYLFEEFNNRVPNNVALSDVPTTAQISTYRNIEEEPDKIYFWRWIFHDGIKSNAKPENLDKTRRLLGLKAYNACKKRNISSGWSADPAKEKRDSKYINRIYD